jgi:hypothetical protein
VLGLGVGQTGDTVARVGLFSDGAIKFGPGSSTAVDVGISRSNTNTIQFNTGTLSTGTAYVDYTYAIPFNAPFSTSPGGRLYMTTAAPYGDHAAATTVFYGPAVSNTILINNGTGYILQTFSEVSFSTAALASGVYDVYVKSASNTTLATPTTAAWSGSTPPTRTTDNYGRSCKSGDTTSLLVGAVSVNGSNNVTDNTATRGVCNIYNVAARTLFAQIASTSWTYASTTWRASNANTTDGQGRFSFLVANAQSPTTIDATFMQGLTANGGAGGSAIGLDSTTAPYNSSFIMNSAGANATSNTVRQTITAPTAGVGLHYLQMLEVCSTPSSFTFYGVGNLVTAAAGDGWMQGVVNQ